MSSSKNLSSLTITIATLGLLFFQTSCLRSASDNPDSAGISKDATGDFRVLQTFGASINDEQNETWTVPTLKNYQFRACVVSRITNAILPIGQKFRVTQADKPDFVVETDKDGCLQWKEVVHFNYSGDSVYIEKTRTIVGAGTYRGQETIRMAINPWMEYRQETGQEVIDLDRSDLAANRLVPESESDLALAGRFGRSSGKNLLIENAPAFQLIPKQDIADGKRMKMIIRMKPFIEPLKMNGDPVRTYFRRGQFRVYAQLVANYLGPDAEQRLILSTELPWQDITMTEDGLLTFTGDIDLKRRVSMGQVQLALKVEPREAPFPMNNYEGLHNIGSFDEIFGAKGVGQVEGSLSRSAFDYSSFVEGAKNFDELKEAGWVKDLPPVYYSQMEPRFVRIKSGETATKRTIIYRVTTTVTDSVTGKPVIFQPFKIVRKTDKTEAQVESDHEGRIRWMNEITHLYYQPEQYMFPEFTISQVASRAQQPLTLAINPWDEGWTFGADVRGNEAWYQKMSEVEVREPLLMVDAFRYQTIRFRYVIDEFLTLNVKKAVVMALDPLVQRYTIMSGRKFEPLRDGIYLAKIALVKYYIDPFQSGTHLIRDPETNEHSIRQVREGGEARKGEYTTVIKKLLRVQAGRITTPIEFSMRDLRMMSIRSNIMVQIETIDEEKLLRDNIVEGKIRKLVEEYTEFQARSANMTEAEKQAYFDAKMAEVEQGHEKFQATLEKELEILRAQRDSIGDLQSKRFQLLSELEDSVAEGQAAANRAEYENILNLPQREFDARTQKARSELSSMHEKMSEYWRDWNATDWLNKTYVEDQGPIPLHGGSDMISESNVHYADYLASMQVFYEDFGLPFSVSNDDVRLYQRNNYTENPAAPFVDLNLYRNKSGLKRRTFIGPCTLVENDNMSEMRPTDTIDEKYCDRIDCGETLYEPKSPPADNSEFENSAHHDSLKPFASMFVDEVIEMHKKNEERYENEMAALSQRGHFVEAFNLSYVSLAGKALSKYKQGCHFEGEISTDCFEDTTENVVPAQDLFANLNSGDSRKLMEKYFFLNSYDKLLEIEEDVERVNSLQPLWDRSVGYGGWLLGKTVRVESSYGKQNRVTEDIISSKYNGTIPEISQQHVRQWLAHGIESVELYQALKICQALTNQTVSSLEEQDLLASDGWVGRSGATKAHDQLLTTCLKKLTYLPDREQIVFEGFSIDRRYKILRTGTYEHRAGKNMNINVGIDFGVSSYDDISDVVSAGVNGVALLGLAVAGVGAVAGWPLVAAAGLAGFGGFSMFSGSVNEATGSNMAVATSVNAATFLVVQKAEMDIEILEHEKCLTLQFTPNLIEDLKIKRMGLRKNVKPKDPRFVKALTRGYMVCDGEIHTAPEKIRENYYYVTQHFTAGDMLDDVNLLNHVWLLSLRGQRDFNTFISTMKAKKINQDGEVIPDRNVYDYSLWRLGKIYDQVIPTFPGMYAVPN